MAFHRAWLLLAALFLACQGGTRDPCTEEMLQQVRTEASNFATDTLERVHDVLEPRADNSGDRFVLSIARDIADALLGFIEAFYLQICLLSGCARCAVEVDLAAPGSHEALARITGLAPRFRLLDDRLVIFTEVFDSAADMAEEEEERRRSPSPLPEKRSSVVTIRNDLAQLREEGLAQKLDRSFSRRAALHSFAPSPAPAPEAGEDEALQRQVIEMAMLGRNLVATMHAQVAEAFNLMPHLALEGRHLPGLQSGWAHEPFFKYLNHSGTSSLELFALLRGERRAAWPFSRSSELCNRLETAPSGSAVLDRPQRDASGSFTWNSAPAYDLLQVIERSGRPMSYTYWAVRTATQFGKEIPCEAAGILFDPSRCLDEKGWGGSIYFVNPDPKPREKERLYVQWRPRAWNNERSKENPLWKAFLDPITPPSEPMDVLALSPLAGNCELLRKLVTADSMTMARLVYAPINPTMPPPQELEPNFTEFWLDHRAWSRALHKAGTMDGNRLHESGQRFFLAQCSLESVCKMMRPIGYELLHVEHFYAVFAHQSVAKVLQRHQPAYLKAAASGTAAAAAASSPAPFEAWRRGWYCTPLSRYLMDLEARASFDAAWLSPSGADGMPSFCEFLEKYAFLDDQTFATNHSCDASSGYASQHAAAKLPPDSGTDSILPQVQQRRRAWWSSTVANPAVSVIPLLPHYSEGAVQSPEAQAACDISQVKGCACLPPFRGPSCAQRDEAQAEKERPYRAAIAYVMDKAGVAELAFSLQSLWDSFNSKHDYLVIVFHKGLDRHAIETLTLASSNRVWFFKINPSPKSNIANALREFKSGLLFCHAAVEKLDYVWILDSASHFPAEVAEDPFLVLQKDPSLLLAYQRLMPLPSGISSHTRLWEHTQLYLMSHGAQWEDEAKGGSDEGSLSNLISDAAGQGAKWNHQMLADDCGVVRVAALAGREVRYREYLSFITAHAGRLGLSSYDPGVVRTFGVAAVALLSRKDAGTFRVTELANLPYAFRDVCDCAERQRRCRELRTSEGLQVGTNFWSCTESSSE